jgi:hypothetical protein
MKTSTGRLPEYVKYGELHFTLEGKPMVLTVYQNLELIQKPNTKTTYLYLLWTRPMGLTPMAEAAIWTSGFRRAVQ